jgi:hypothetical protein
MERQVSMQLPEADYEE